MASNAPLGQANEGEFIMKGFVNDIESLAVTNEDFRRVLYTAKHCQLVVMALKKSGWKCTRSISSFA
jgi:hypothetical protein